MSGSLTKAVAHLFSAGDRRRGEEYFETAPIEFVQIENNRLHLRVQGSRWYSVILDWRQQGKNGGIEFRCDCLRFDDGVPCKHVYAACLAADATGLTQGVQTSRFLQWNLADETAEPDDAEQAPSPPATRGRAKQPPRKAARAPAPPDWQRQVNQWRREIGYVEPPELGRSSRRASETRFGVCAGKDYGRAWVVFAQQREQLKSGAWGVWKPVRPVTLAERTSDPRAILCAQLLYQMQAGGNSYHYGYAEPTYAKVDLLLTPLFWKQTAGWADLVWLEHHGDNSPAAPRLEYDGDAPYELRLAFEQPGPHEVRVAGRLVRGDESFPLAELQHCDAQGFGLLGRRIVRLHGTTDARWCGLLARGTPLTASPGELDALIARLAELPGAPPLELPPDSGWAYEQRPPTPVCEFVKSDWGTDLLGQARCSYGPQRAFEPGQRWLALPEERRLIARDPAAEERVAQEFKTAVRAAKGRIYSGQATLQTAQFQHLAARLLKLGWQVEAVGQPVRTLGQMHLNVESGIDWFDLQVACDFGGVAATLPELLAALRSGQSLIPLGDGTLGMLPDEWLDKFAPFLELGEAQDGAIRFRSAQAALLDALLAAQDESVAVGRLDELSSRLRKFEGVAPADAPPGFVGELRPYQRQGLGWLQFWQQSGLGGCLADDMGLGKTIQVLALLLADHGQDRAAAPSLIVAPKSLTYNWREEAARFAPALRVGEYLGGERKELLQQAADYDVLLTTYGILRLDVAQLRKQQFRYAILDEAQAIKNADSQSAKAARLLQAEHRLALTGTPVENRLGDLWSLVEFLNPGLLGRGETFRRLAGKSTPDEATLQVVGRAVRPMVLRRTKEQVLTELPEKTEQTLYCDLGPDERRRYDELRDHYRAALSSKIRELGWNKAKLVVLEALLRLRQAACHHGLLDKQRKTEGSAKVDLLLEQLEELRAEGHKALVFSQFTQLLDIVRKKLDEAGASYAYLDGKTKNRQAVVEQFQQDASVSAFLISLKAGGVGLNLTAAEYVFLLDPWWNPAVEAQAIDRAHRIGQQRPVFAYRLIARDTVEEKVLLLQQSKRKLADAIIAGDGASLAQLTAEDLQLLLS